MRLLEMPDQPADHVFGADPGREFEDLLGPVDPGVKAERLVGRRAQPVPSRTHESDRQVGELPHTECLALADVEDLIARVQRSVQSLHGQKHGRGHVLRVHEITTVVPSAEENDLLPAESLEYEITEGVQLLGTLANNQGRPQDDRMDAKVLAVIANREFRGHLARGVGMAGGERGRLVHWIWRCAVNGQA